MQLITFRASALEIYFKLFNKKVQSSISKLSMLYTSLDTTTYPKFNTRKLFMAIFTCTMWVTTACIYLNTPEVL